MSDYISREAAKKAIAVASCLNEASAIINNLPAADVVEKKIGKWIDDGTELGCCCDMCNITLDVFFDGDLSDVRMRKMPNFCPNCGAKME